MSIVEVAIKACRNERVYSYDYSSNRNYYNLTTKCYSHASLGVGIWCSVLVSYILVKRHLKQSKITKSMFSKVLKIYYTILFSKLFFSKTSSFSLKYIGIFLILVNNKCFKINFYETKFLLQS